MIALVLALLTAGIPPLKLHRTQTEREGSPPFDLAPDEVRGAEIAGCRVEETLPMGGGTAEKRRCPGRLDPESAERRCKDAARHDSLPQGVSAESCLGEYQRGRFLFPGELKEVIVARRRDGQRVAAFEVLEGDTLATFQTVGDAVIIGVGGGDRVHYAVVSARGLLRAPRLGNGAREVEVAGGRIRVTGKSRTLPVDLVPRNGELQVEKK